MNTEDAVRLNNAGTYTRLQLPIISSTILPLPSPATGTFTDALARRVSADEFLLPSNQELSDFLNDVFRIRSVNQNDGNRQKRYVASMGALHPAHLLFYLRPKGWYVYLPETHALGELPVFHESSNRIIQLVEEHMPGHGAAVICLLSDCDLVSHYYRNFMPLLFRDAGVLLGHAALVAAAHGLGFRILGRTGTAAAESLVVGLPFRPLATGLALLGANRLGASPVSDRAGA